MRFSCLRLLPLLFLGLLPIRLHAQTPLMPRTESTTRNLSSAYALVVSDEEGLKLIATQFPDLAAQAREAASSFQKAFPSIRRNLETQLTAVGLTPEDLVGDGIKLSNSIKVQRPGAVAFINRVKARARGDLDAFPDVLKTLLAVQYLSSPEIEITQGFTETLQVDGTGKAQGLRMRLDYPKSWEARPGKGPHVLNLLQSQDGIAMMVITVTAAQDFWPPTATQTDVQGILDTGQWKTLLSQAGSHPISAKVVHLGGVPALEMEFDNYMPAADPKIYQRGLLYCLVVRGKALTIQTTTGGPHDRPAETQADYQRYRPVFLRMVSSLVLPQ